MLTPTLTREGVTRGLSVACSRPSEPLVVSGSPESAIRADWTVEKYGQFCQRRFIELRGRGVAPSVAFSVYHHACNQYERMAAQMDCKGLPAHRFDERRCGVVKHKGDKTGEDCVEARNLR